MKKIILCPNPSRDQGLSATRRAEEILQEMGFHTVVCPPFKDQRGGGYGDYPVRPLPPELKTADLLGDGFAALHPGLHRRRGGVGHAGSARGPRLTGTLLPQGFGGACKVPRRLTELVLPVSELLFVGFRHGFSPPNHSLSHILYCILYFDLIY